MTSEYELYYQDVEYNKPWAFPEVSDCGCRGRGWFVSQLDTYHRCPYHGKDAPHPEEDTDSEIAEFNAACPPEPESQTTEDDLPF